MLTWCLLRLRIETVRPVRKFKSPSLAKGVPSRSAPSSPALTAATAPALAAAAAVATPLLVGLASAIPRLLDEFCRVVTTGVEDGIRDVASAMTK